MTRNQFTVLVVACLAFTACESPTEQGFTQEEVTGPAARVAPLLGSSGNLPTLARYMVRLQDNVPNPEAHANEVLPRLTGARLDFVIDRVFKGFAVTMPPQAARALQRNPRVMYVELLAPEDPATSVSVSNWGLDRVDQRDWPGNWTYTYYGTGAGTEIWVIDSGIYSSHSEFQGRTVVGEGGYNGSNPLTDCHGHGTQVASVAAGNTVGVSRQTSLHVVKIYPDNQCSGSSPAGALAWGINRAANRLTPGRAVVNVSYNGVNQSTADAINGLKSVGAVVAKAAGNSNQDACTLPGNLPTNAVVVGAIQNDKNRWPSSNWGSCLNVFAPGHSVAVATNSGSYTNSQGTSIAAPFVAGTIANLLSQHPGTSWWEQGEAISQSASRNTLGSIGVGSPNRVLYSLYLWANLPTFGIAIPKTYFFSANAIGGNGSYSYVWEYSTDGNSWSVVGYSSSYSRNVSYGDPSFALRLTVSSGGASFTTEEWYYTCWDEGEC